MSYYKVQADTTKYDTLHGRPLRSLGLVTREGICPGRADSDILMDELEQAQAKGQAERKDNTRHWQHCQW